MRCTLGVDVGTSSTKGVLVDEDGRIVTSVTRGHEVTRPHTGWVEMDADIWWDEFASIARQLIDAQPDAVISAVGVSGMGPCVLLADADDEPVRPAILYGVDTRAGAQILRMTEELGASEITRVGGSTLTSQAAGAKIAWISDEEPDAFTKAVRYFMPASWLARKLTGSYVLDHQSASQSSPLYDIESETWYEPWWQKYAATLEQPRLTWAGDIAGTVTDDASEATGIPADTPVITGTIDAWTEAVSVGAHEVGDLMLMYGTTMFLINTLAERVTVPELWGTVGAFEGTRSLAGGMATSGAITSWLKELMGNVDYATLLALAADSPTGARGLLMLPYFAGERTPIADPDARGIIAGLTVEHTAGDLYRAALEATAMGVRHNIEAMVAAGGDIRRIVAVGGGTQGGLWAQIVSDVTGRAQEIPTVTIGASYGAAFLAAQAVSEADIHVWNPLAHRVVPDIDHKAGYEQLYRLYRELYSSTAAIAHELAHRQHLSA